MQGLRSASSALGIWYRRTFRDTKLSNVTWRTRQPPFRPKSRSDGFEGENSKPAPRTAAKKKTAEPSGNHLAGSSLPAAVVKRVTDYVSSLNDEQLKAVLCQSPAVRVKAGPGRWVYI